MALGFLFRAKNTALYGNYYHRRIEMTFINNTVNKTKNFVSKYYGITKAVVGCVAAVAALTTISWIMRNAYVKKILGWDDEC